VSVTTVRPNATQYAGQWREPPSSTDLHTPTSDNSDSSFIRGFVGYPLNGNYCRVGMGTVSPGATERIKRVMLRVRYRKNGTSGNYQMAKFTLHDPQLDASKTLYWIRATTTTPTTVDFGWWSTPPKGTEWTKAIIDRLNFYCVSYNNIDHSAIFMDILELYCDVDVVGQATVTGVGVTGTTTTSQPEIGFTFNANADGDQQRSLQGKVFTLAQTTAAGFNPASSEPIWDSGVIRSNATTLPVGLSLVNGITYVAYIRASADFNGSDWWSSWAASSNFTMAYIAPPTPTLTVTPETVLPSLRTRLVVDTKLNMLTADDSSHETTIGSWTGNANCTAVRSNTQALDGSWSMRMTATGAGDMSAITLGGPFTYPVTPGEQYTYGTQFRAGSTGRTVRVKVQWVDAEGNAIGSPVAGSNGSDTSGAWSSVVFVTATAPDGAHGVRFIDEVVAAAAAEIHYSDKAFWHRGTSTTWTPGGMQKTDTWGFATRLDRTVIESLDWAMPTSDSPNLINPNIATGGEAYQDTHGYARRSTKDMVELDRTGTKQRSGELCIRWIVGETTNSVLDIGTAQGAYSSFTEVPTATLPGVPGRQYTLSQFIRALAGSGHSVALAAQPIDATGAAVGSAFVGSTVEVGTTMVPLAVTYTMPAGAAGVRGEIRNLDSSATSFFLDDAQLEEGAVRTEWRRPVGLITNWRPVRGALTGLIANVRDGVATIHDREIPPGVMRMYRAWTEIDAGGGNFARSAFTAYVPAQLDPPGVYVLKDPQQPAHDLVPTALGLIGNRIDQDFTEYHLDRPNRQVPYGQGVVIVSEWISGTNGQMTVSVRDPADWLNLRALIQMQRAILVQMPSGGQRWVSLTSRNWSEPRIPFTFWKVVVDFVEADRPPVVR
jgi:hypothetical protein